MSYSMVYTCDFCRTETRKRTEVKSFRHSGHPNKIEFGRPDESGSHLCLQCWREVKRLAKDDEQEEGQGGCEPQSPHQRVISLD